MSVNIELQTIVYDGERYWRTQDVLNAVSELLVACRTDDERQIVAWFLRAMRNASRKP